jgi:hypothetical protein
MDNNPPTPEELPTDQVDSIPAAILPPPAKLPAKMYEYHHLTQANHEETKQHRKAAAKSRKINRRKR